MKNEGYIVIADITGYTMYLSESELEHAESVLRSLLSLLVEHTDAPLQLSRLEGDAVISFAMAQSLLAGTTLVDKIETTYVAFRRALQQMVLNTTCNCRACANIVGLDLKFFIHYGSFMVQQLSGQQELVGSDVNLIFRLTKNTISPATGIEAYAAYTSAVIEAMQLDEFAKGLTTHQESYEHVGQVLLFVQDLHAVWKAKADEVLVEIPANDVLLVLEETFTIPPTMLWEYITDPRYRHLLFNTEATQMSGQQDGRTGEGSVYICAHGEELHPHTVVEWHPFEQYCFMTEPVSGITQLNAFQLEPVAGGTIFRYTLSKPRGPFLKRIFVQPVSKRFTIKGATAGIKLLKETIESEVAEGKVRPAEYIHLEESTVAAAAKESVRPIT